MFERRKATPGQPHGPEVLAEIISRVFVSRGWGRQQERVRLENAWIQAVGPEMAPHTRLGAFRRGVLEVEVTGAVRMQELAQFQKRRLLESIRGLLPGQTVSDLKFRAAR